MPCSSLSASMLLPHVLIDGAAKAGRTSLANGTQHVAVKLRVTWHPFLESQGGCSDTNNQRPLAWGDRTRSRSRRCPFYCVYSLTFTLLVITQVWTLFPLYVKFPVQVIAAALPHTVFIAHDTDQQGQLPQPYLKAGDSNRLGRAFLYMSNFPYR